MNTKQILELKLDNDDFDPDMTIRDYLRELLIKLWEDGEGFSGKRPFGNSGWEYDLYVPLIKAGVVPGEIDEWGGIEDVNSELANTTICSCIKVCCEA